MADVIDSGTEAAELFLTAALSKQHNHPEVAHTGECLNCGARVRPPRRWCNADCRDDWQRANDRSRANVRIED